MGDGLETSRRGDSPSDLGMSLERAIEGLQLETYGREFSLEAPY